MKYEDCLVLTPGNGNVISPLKNKQRADSRSAPAYATDSKFCNLAKRKNNP